MEIKITEHDSPVTLRELADVIERSQQRKKDAVSKSIEELRSIFDDAIDSLVDDEVDAAQDSTPAGNACGETSTEHTQDTPPAEAPKRRTRRKAGAPDTEPVAWPTPAPAPPAPEAPAPAPPAPPAPEAPAPAPPAPEAPAPAPPAPPAPEAPAPAPAPEAPAPAPPAPPAPEAPAPAPPAPPAPEAPAPAPEAETAAEPDPDPVIEVESADTSGDGWLTVEEYSTAVLEGKTHVEQWAILRAKLLDRVMALNPRRTTEIADAMNALKPQRMFYRVQEPGYTWMIPGLAPEEQEVHAKKALATTINLILTYK